MGVYNNCYVTEVHSSKTYQQWFVYRGFGEIMSVTSLLPHIRKQRYYVNW